MTTQRKTRTKINEVESQTRHRCGRASVHPPATPPTAWFQVRLKSKNVWGEKCPRGPWIFICTINKSSVLSYSLGSSAPAVITHSLAGTITAPCCAQGASLIIHSVGPAPTLSSLNTSDRRGWASGYRTLVSTHFEWYICFQKNKAGNYPKCSVGFNSTTDSKGIKYDEKQCVNLHFVHLWTTCCRFSQSSCP